MPNFNFLTLPEVGKLVISRAVNEGVLVYIGFKHSKYTGCLEPVCSILELGSGDQNK